MVYILLLSAGVIYSICFQANGHCTTPECKDASEGIDEILVTTSVMLSGCVQENGQCTTSACEDSSTATDETDHCRSTSVVCDCSDIKANGYTTSGVYRIYVVDEGQRYYANVFCDMTTTNDAWTVFQRRKDGRIDFYRKWNEYANGFGNSSGEFWLDSLTYHNDQRFSTKDNDNDADSTGNDAVRFHAGWWYSSGHQSNLNGLYLRGPYTITSCSPTCYEGITWNVWRNWDYSLKTTEMKISPL